MEYRIFNERIIQDAALKEKISELIEVEMEGLEHAYASLSAHLYIELSFKRAEDSKHRVSALVKLKESIVYRKKDGADLEALLHDLFDELRLILARRLHKESKDHIGRRLNKQVRAFSEHVDELQTLQREDEPAMFKRLLGMLFKDVARYIRRRLKSAEMTTAVKRGRFKVQELLDEIYLKIYERIHEIPRDTFGMQRWLFRQADEYLDEKFREVEFEREHLEELDRMVDAELERFSEPFTVDADLELVPPDELEDYRTYPERYYINDLLVAEGEDNIIDEITLRMNHDEIHHLIEKNLSKLPVQTRTIMDLYLINQLSVEEIAKIKDLPVPVIETMVRDGVDHLKRQLL